jgi:protein phosphatase 2C family protein 2/3
MKKHYRKLKNEDIIINSDDNEEKIQEIEYNIINNLNSKDITLHNIGYFGLFDGHGGGKISKFCKKHLHKYFLDNEKCKTASKSKDYDKYINKTYISVQNKL